MTEEVLIPEMRPSTLPMLEPPCDKACGEETCVPSPPY
jgi:hypothetical protein